MKAVFSLLFFISILSASNPKTFATLGDTIYDNAKKIEKLKKFKEYQPFVEKIDSYVKDVNKTKKLGFELQSEMKNETAHKYLEQLRKLSRTNDFFIRSTDAVFKKALQSNDYELLMELLDTGLVDVRRYKERLLEFYEENKGRFVPYGTLEQLIKEEKERKKSQTKEELQHRREHERVRHLREDDKKHQEELQKKLEMEIGAQPTASKNQK